MSARDPSVLHGTVEAAEGESGTESSERVRCDVWGRGGGGGHWTSGPRASMSCTTSGHTATTGTGPESDLPLVAPPFVCRSHNALHDVRGLRADEAVGAWGMAQEGHTGRPARPLTARSAARRRGDARRHICVATEAEPTAPRPTHQPCGRLDSGSMTSACK